ncbi:MAG TPA: glycosyltransferase family 4 protein [Candidatus Krumholzibacteria bacterium]|nr:glycosyltransferase family 4 protein [Candidatus Krumholzibacteria bacterium]HPD71321.1 glycosyltransferase family 4 protein [Candidatus Krumholzibacteria bacterium]HRY38979.1 glycosyltransferase family 4 protein [Candidatus Krumholzibacteria bacterium]
MTAPDSPRDRTRRIRVAHVVTIYRGIVGMLEPKLVALAACDDLDVCCITAPRPDDLELPPPRVRQISCPMDRRVHPLRDTASIVTMARIFARERFDIVHSHSAKAGMIAALAARSAPVPFLVHTYHGLPFFAGQAAATYAACRALEALACRSRDFCLSQNLRDLPAIADLMGSADRVAYEGNGVDIADLVAKAGAQREAGAARFGAGRLRIALVSRLEPVKNVGDFLHVVRRLVAAGHDATAAIAGYGPERERLEALARRLGLSDRVAFLGWCPEVPGLLAAADVVMLTSRKEGIPRSLIEAMALARPVVATDVLGTQELVADGVTGYLCPCGDVAMLAQRVAALAADAGLRRALGDAGRQRVAEHFDDREIAARLAAFYRAAAGGARGRALKTGFVTPEPAGGPGGDPAGSPRVPGPFRERDRNHGDP